MAHRDRERKRKRFSTKRVGFLCVFLCVSPRPLRLCGERSCSFPLRSMTILDRVQSPTDVRELTPDELRQLCDDIRVRLIDVCSRTGGHIGAGLGVVELTVALHYAFETPRDQLVWDVGHQGYPHKVLTGRNKDLETLRQEHGVSGFLKRTESEYDAFGAGHAATSISAALGIAAGRDVLHDDYKVVAIIGDGSLTSGLAYEGLNNAGHSDRNI